MDGPQLQRAGSILRIGVACRTCHTNDEVCYALFDLVSAADVVAGAPQRLADHRAVVDQLMALHGALFDTDPPVTLP